MSFAVASSTLPAPPATVKVNPRIMRAATELAPRALYHVTLSPPCTLLVPATTPRPSHNHSHNHSHKRCISHQKAMGSIRHTTNNINPIILDHRHHPYHYHCRRRIPRHPSGTKSVNETSRHSCKKPHNRALLMPTPDWARPREKAQNSRINPWLPKEVHPLLGGKRGSPVFYAFFFFFSFFFFFLFLFFFFSCCFFSFMIPLLSLLCTTHFTLNANKQ